MTESYKIVWNRVLLCVIEYPAMKTLHVLICRSHLNIIYSYKKHFKHYISQKIVTKSDIVPCR